MSNGALAPGSSLKLADFSRPAKLERFKGVGGQGEVWVIAIDQLLLALKWYNEEMLRRDPYLRERLRMLIGRGSPAPDFAWPLYIADVPSIRGRFGYVMPLVEDPFMSLGKVLTGSCAPGFRVLAAVGRNIAQAFLDLHALGLCYCDISHDNIRFDPGTGAVRVIDNDNCDVDGSTNGIIAGSPGYMAPEIVRGHARPNTQTDLHSLAVLLFRMLMLHHPLDGKREAKISYISSTVEADLHRLYGTDPLFIFDPNDETNYPVPGWQDAPLEMWPLYPKFIRDMFTRAFTDGLRDPMRRVMESEWRKAMIRLQDAVYPCSHCGSENIFDPSRSGSSLPRCWNCREILPPVLTLSLRRDQVTIAPEAQLYPHHLAGKRDFDFSRVLARVVQRRSDPSQLGLANESDVPWRVSLNGKSTEVEPGTRVAVEPGMLLDFGPVQGEIKLS